MNDRGTAEVPRSAEDAEKIKRESISRSWRIAILYLCSLLAFSSSSALLGGSAVPAFINAR